jgi:hypothetical protein
MTTAANECVALALLPGLSTGQRQAGQKRFVSVARVLVDLRLLAGVSPVCAVALGTGHPELFARLDVVEVRIEVGLRSPGNSSQGSSMNGRRPPAAREPYSGDPSRPRSVSWPVLSWRYMIRSGMCKA